MEAATTLYDLNKDQLKEVFDNCKAKLKEFGLEKVKFNFYRQRILGQRDIKQSVLVFEGMVSSSLEEKVSQLKTELEKILGTYGEDAFALEVEVGLGEGKKFPPLNGLAIVPSKEPKDFECTPGEAYLIDFWATWCGPCQGPMQHNQEIMERNEEKWKGKARIIGVSLDDEIDVVTKRVEERKWQKVEHYQSPGGFNSPAAAQFGIQGIPCVFLVDKKGIIRFRGHPSSVDIEKKLNEFIAEGEEGAPAKAEETENTKAPTCSIHGCSDDHSNKASSTTIETELQICKKFEELYGANKNIIEKISGLTVGFIGSREVSANEEKFSGRVLLAGLIGPQDKPGVLEFWKNVIQPLVKDYGVDFDNRLGVSENPEVKCGSACATCKKALGNDVPHYVCTVCQSEAKEDHAFCVECADKECSQDITSAKDLFHPHGLLFLHKDSQDALKSLKRILNTTVVFSDDHPNYAKIKEIKGVPGVYCDVCSTSPLPTYRWACANCGDFDLCANCFKAATDPNNEKHKETIEKAEERGHKDSHVFYRAHYLIAIRSLQPKPFEVPK